MFFYPIISMQKEYQAPEGLYTKMFSVLFPERMLFPYQDYEDKRFYIAEKISTDDVVWVAEELEKIFPEAKKEDIFHTNRYYLKNGFDCLVEVMLSEEFIVFDSVLFRAEGIYKKFKKLGGDDPLRGNINEYITKEMYPHGNVEYEDHRPGTLPKERLKKPARDHLQRLYDEAKEHDRKLKERERSEELLEIMKPVLDSMKKKKLK